MLLSAFLPQWAPHLPISGHLSSLVSNGSRPGPSSSHGTHTPHTPTPTPTQHPPHSAPRLGFLHPPETRLRCGALEHLCNHGTSQVKDRQAGASGRPWGEAVSPHPPSWGISVDRPLISGRKQGPVTRSGGRGNTQGFGHREPWGGAEWDTGPGVNPFAVRLLSAPHLLFLEAAHRPGTVRLCQARHPTQGYSTRPLASGQRNDPCSAPSLCKALFWLPVSHV